MEEFQMYQLQRHRFANNSDKQPEQLGDGNYSRLPSLKVGYLQIVEILVDLVGIEPTTSSMPWKRAPSCATGPLLVGKDLSILAHLSRRVKLN